MKAAVTDVTPQFSWSPCGEAGVGRALPGTSPAARDLRRHGLLLVLDEVQTASGATGRMFAWEPPASDRMSSPSPRASPEAFPRASCSRPRDAAAPSFAGDHGSTFGCNALASAAICAVLDAIESEHLVETRARMGARLASGSSGFARPTRFSSIRAAGLLAAADLDGGGAIVEACPPHGLSSTRCGRTRCGFAPPLIVSPEEVDRAIRILDEVFTSASVPETVAATDYSKELP